MSDKVPYHAYEKRGKMIEERDKRIAELEAENRQQKAIIDAGITEYAGHKLVNLQKDNERLLAKQDYKELFEGQKLIIAELEANLDARKALREDEDAGN